LEVNKSHSKCAALIACAECFTGCDKTTPAQLMGGISANKPIVQLVTGPMMPGSHKGTRVGACTDCRNNWAKYRAGTIDIEEISAINEELAPTVQNTIVST
jgi:dihydroxy-acid dehydratase